MASKGKTASFPTITGCVISPCPLWEKAQPGALRDGFQGFSPIQQLSMNQQLANDELFYTGAAQRVH